MELKLFAAKRSCGYCGGLIVVAANTIDEAYDTYTKWATDNGDPNCVYSAYESDGELIVINNRYPRENWYEIYGVKAVCDAPRVIDEDGYTE